MKKYFFAISLLVASAFVVASASEEDLAQLVGYTVIGQYHITGWRDKDGKSGKAYEGCNYGRVLILDDQYAVTCSGYWYEYAYRPTVTMLKNGASLKMILNGNVRDVQ